MTAAKAPPRQAPFPRLDLRRFCKSRASTLVRAEWDGSMVDWLLLGEVELAEVSPRGVLWKFGARLGRGATDYEHDASWAVSMLLIGVRLDLVMGDSTLVTGFILPRDDEDFRVTAGDPFADATRCGAFACPKRHPIVPFMPRRDPALFEVMRGRKISIGVSSGK